MAERTLPNVGLKGGYDPGEGGWGPGMKDNLLILSILTQGTVINKVAAEPGSPTAGDIYILDETHGTNPNKIAVFDGEPGSEAWFYVDPNEGWLLYNQTANYYEKFDGAVWAELATGGGGGLTDAPSDGDLYARRNGAWEAFVAGGGGGGGGLWEFVETISVTAGAQLDVPLGDGEDYLIVVDTEVSSDGANLLARYTDDGFSTVESGASHYAYGYTSYNAAAFTDTGSSTAADSMLVGKGIGNGAGEKSRFHMRVATPSDAAEKTVAVWDGFGFNTGGFPVNVARSFGTENAASVVNGVRFLPSAGTITGTARVYKLVTAASGGGGGSAWDLQWNPMDNEPPATNYATLDTRNSRPVLDFDTSNQEAAIFTGILPADYAGGGVTVSLWCSLSTATTGTVGWDVALERTQASTDDIDSDSFATAQVVTAATVPGTSGQVLVMTVNIANGADMDNLAAGEMFRLRVRRNVAVDTAAGDAELLRVTMVEQ